MSAANLIDQLNPKIRGWANYHRHVVSKSTFERVDCNIFSSLWQWARRRHPNKPSRWVKAKYFERRRDCDWTFFDETCDDEGRPRKVWLFHAESTPIKRQVKVQGEANPTIPPMKPTSKNVKGLTCWTRFGVVAGELLILPVAGASNIVTFCHPGDSPIELVVADFKGIRARYHFGEGQHTQTSGK
jgi:hypothetical protein